MDDLDLEELEGELGGFQSAPKAQVIPRRLRGRISQQQQPAPSEPAPSEPAPSEPAPSGGGTAGARGGGGGGGGGDAIGAGSWAAEPPAAEPEPKKQGGGLFGGKKKEADGIRAFTPPSKGDDLDILSNPTSKVSFGEGGVGASRRSPSPEVGGRRSPEKSPEKPKDQALALLEMMDKKV